MELNKICLPENYPHLFFKSLAKNYPKLFIVAEKNSEAIFFNDKELLDIIKLIRNIRSKSISVEKLIKLKGISYTKAKEALEKILKASDGLPAPLRFFRKYYSDGVSFYSLIDDPKVIGYIICRLEGGISSFKFKWVKKGHVVSIAVDEPYRKLGIGRALLESSIIEIEKENASEQVLEVRVTNYEAFQMYQKLGFKIVKTLKGYYHDGSDAYFMARTSDKL